MCVCITCGIFNGVVSSSHYVAPSVSVCCELQIGGHVDGIFSGQIVGAAPQFAQKDRRKAQNVAVGFFGVSSHLIFYYIPLYLTDMEQVSSIMQCIKHLSYHTVNKN